MVTTKDIPAGEPISPDSPERDQPYRKELDPGLANRLDNLWPGHPSSPYAADGTRKPPVPNPFRNEAPIPGDPDYRAEIHGGPGDAGPEGQPRQALAARDKPAQDEALALVERFREKWAARD